MSDDPTPTTADSTQTSPDSGPVSSWPAVDRKRAALWVVTVTFVAILGYVAWRYVGTLAMALFVYYVTRPVFRRISPRVGGRTTAVALTLAVVALPVVVLVGWAFAILAQSLNDLLGSDVFAGIETLVQPYVELPTLLADVEQLVTEILEDPGRLSELGVGPVLGDLLNSLTVWLGTAFNAGIHAFIVLIVVFYLLRDDYRIAAWSRSTFLDGGVVESYLETVDRDLHNVYFGNILNALVTGVLAALVYTLLNLAAPPVVRIPEAAFLGLLVGVASLVPVIGIKIVTWPVGGYLLVRALVIDPTTVWFPAVFLLVSFVVVDYIPDQLLRPYVSGRTLHVGAVMLAYTIGPLLFGWYGIFLAPLVFVVVFEFGRIVFPWLLAPERVAAGLSAAPAGPPAPTSTPEPEPESGEPSETPGDDSVTGAGDD